MTETPPEATQDAAPPFDAPEDTADDIATGYAVYDRQLGRYVTGVTADKPSASDARKAANGHSYRTVRV